MKKILLTALVLLAAASVFAKKNKKDGPLVIGATPVPHVQLLELVKADVEAKGYKLDIREMTDYVILNDALESGELDANFDQHTPYMEATNKDKGYHLVTPAAFTSSLSPCIQRSTRNWPTFPPRLRSPFPTTRQTADAPCSCCRPPA